MDFIDTMLAHTDGTPSPEIFRQWSAIAAVSGLLERRVWTMTARNPIFTNMYILLVAPPAVGKTMSLKEVEKLWMKCPGLKIAPQDVTNSSLIDALHAAPKQMVLSPTHMEDYHALAVAAGELGVLLPAYDNAMISLLNYIYDCPAAFNQTRRTGNKSIYMPNPCLTILAGAQPGYLATTFPEEAWSMGFASRMLMIYASTPVKVSLFKKVVRDMSREDWLESTAEEISMLKGEVTWDDDAAATLERWNDLDLTPIPTHTKLQHYNGRRIINMVKLMMISAVSRNRELNIKLEDFERAQNWLLHAESLMPDIFRDMVHRSDNDILQELHYYVWRKYTQGGKAPIHEAAMVNFLQTKVPSDKMFHILRVAERSNMMVKTETPGGNLWIPRPKAEHGMESGG